MHSFEVHSNESACRKSGRLGLDQVLTEIAYDRIKDEITRMDTACRRNVMKVNYMEDFENLWWP